MNKITVTQPFLPPLTEFIPYLEDIWEKKWLTNNGFYHKELEKALCEYLKVPYISLFTIRISHLFELNVIPRDNYLL